MTCTPESSICPLRPLLDVWSATGKHFRNIRSPSSPNNGIVFSTWSALNTSRRADLRLSPDSSTLASACNLKHGGEKLLTSPAAEIRPIKQGMRYI